MKRRKEKEKEWTRFGKLNGEREKGGGGERREKMDPFIKLLRTNGDGKKIEKSSCRNVYFEK